MEDGREIIDQTYKTIKGISETLDDRKENYAEAKFLTLRKEVDESLNWAKKCRNKVWLRSKEGTDLAQGCLDVANVFRSMLDNNETISDESYTLLMKLENLAKIIATKASVMT
ncbi:MAG: hypothetical protein AB7V48_17860 [Sedimentibacter sp.]